MLSNIFVMFRRETEFQYCSGIFLQNYLPSMPGYADYGIFRWHMPDRPPQRISKCFGMEMNCKM